MVVAEDLGDTGAIPGSTVTLTDRLPEGLEAKHVSGSNGRCEVRAGEAREVTCSVEGKEAALRAYGDFTVSITVAVSESAQPGVNTMSISGGGAASVSSSSPIGVGGEPAFGIEQYEMRAENADGSLDTQAGSHPFQLTTALTLNQTADPGKPPAAVKDLRFKLPAGLIGNPTPFPQCPLAKFVTEEDGHNLCPDDTVVGVASATIALTLDAVSKAETEPVPLFNLTPSTGEPARFGFYYKQDPVYLDTSVRTGSDYGVTVSVSNITELASTLSSRVTFWGVPGDSRHDPVRGFNCLDPREREAVFAPCTATEQEAPPPLLAMPTACGGPPHTSVEGDSWQDEGVFTAPLQYTFQDKFGNPSALDGCNQLPFDPSIKATPDGSAGSTPTGLNVDVHVDQEAILNGTSLAQSNVKDITVAFPEGVILDPSAADGLQACSESQVGYLPGESHPPGELHFTPTVPGGTSALVHEETAPLEPGVNACPNAAKIATVKIRSPLLPPGHLVEGAMYLASPQNFHSFPAENPFQSLVAMYIVAEDPVSGTVVKLPGSVSLNQATGQITATFEDNPQLAFEDAEIHLLRRRTRAAGDPGTLWQRTRPTRRSRRGRRNPRGDVVVELPDLQRPERRALSGSEPAVHAQPRVRHDEHQRGRVQPADHDALAPDGGSEHPVGDAALPAGPIRAALGRDAVLRSAGERGDVRRGESDRGNDRLRRPGLRPVHRHRREGVHHRPVPGRPVRVEHRQPREGWPVRPAAGPAGDRQGEDRSRPDAPRR